MTVDYNRTSREIANLNQDEITNEREENKGRLTYYLTLYLSSFFPIEIILLVLDVFKSNE